MKRNREISSAEGIRDYLMKHKLTLSVAESVTCGYLQASFAHIEFTSQFFQGGITAYNLGQKVRHLNVEPIGAELKNCVSRKVAEQMALEVTQLFISDVGISITGYASPMPEQEIYDLFAYFAVVKDGKLLLVEKITTDKKGMLSVQKDYCEQVLEKTFKLFNHA